MAETALRTLLLEIYGHLGAAKSQALPSDDRIVSEHVSNALALTKAALDVERQQPRQQVAA